MSTFKISQQDTNQILNLETQEKKNKKLNEIYSLIEENNKKFDPQISVDIPDKVKLERVEYTKPSDEEIKTKVESDLSQFKELETSKIEGEHKLKVDKQFESHDNLVKDADEQKAEVNLQVEQNKVEAKNDAIDNGLARSSIVISQERAFDEAGLAEYKKIDSELKGNLDAINFELSNLNSQKDLAIQEFNVEYAITLQEQIDKLVAQSQQLEQEALEYNNKIALQEAEFNKDVDELKAEIEQGNFENSNDLITLYGKYGKNVVDKVIEEETYEIVKAELSKLTKQEINDILEDPEFKNRVGSYYDVLVKEFM